MEKYSHYLFDYNINSREFPVVFGFLDIIEMGTETGVEMLWSLCYNCSKENTRGKAKRADTVTHKQDTYVIVNAIVKLLISWR